MSRVEGRARGGLDLSLAGDEDDPRIDGVLRVLRGEDLRSVAADLALEPDLLGRWLAQFVAGGRDRVTHQSGHTGDDRSDRLLALVAHELRTPVSSIAGWLRVLSEHLDDAHDGATALGEVRASTERLRRLVDDLLDMTAASLGRYRYVGADLDLRDLVLEATADDPHIDVTLPQEEPRVRGDEDGLVRVVQRMLQGARLGDVRAPLRLAVSCVGPWAEVEVTRVGAQLPFDTVHAMLEPFEATADQPVHSLGLYMARSVAVAHRGYLGARGSRDGTSFWLRLPRTDRS